MDLPDRAAIRVKAKKMIGVISAGPNISATVAKGAASRISTASLNMSPVADE